MKIIRCGKCLEYQSGITITLTIKMFFYVIGDRDNFINDQNVFLYRGGSRSLTINSSSSSRLWGEYISDICIVLNLIYPLRSDQRGVGDQGTGALLC